MHEVFVRKVLTVEEDVSAVRRHDNVVGVVVQGLLDSLRVSLPKAPSMLLRALPALLPLEIDAEESELPILVDLIGCCWLSLTKLAAPPRPMW